MLRSDRYPAYDFDHTQRRLPTKRAKRIVHGTLLLAQTKKAWAAELGLSHEALYRTLRRLQQADDGKPRSEFGEKRAVNRLELHGRWYF